MKKKNKRIDGVLLLFFVMCVGLVWIIPYMPKYSSICNQTNSSIISNIDSYFDRNSVQAFCTEKDGADTSWFGCTLEVGITCSAKRDGWSNYVCHPLSEYLEWKVGGGWYTT